MLIAVRLPNWLGDIVMALDFLRDLRESYPKCRFIFIIKPLYKAVLEVLEYDYAVEEFDKKTFPGLSGVRSFSKKFVSKYGKASIYYCMPPSFSSALMGKFIAKEVVGYQGNWRGMLLDKPIAPPGKIHRSEEYRGLLGVGDHQKPIKKQIIGKTSKKILININSEASSRRVSIENWKQLIENLGEQDFFLIGAPSDSERVSSLTRILSENVRVTNLAGKTSIPELIRLFKDSKLLISNDSGPAHLAAGFGLDVAVFFGAGDPDNTAPIPREGIVHVLSRKLSCSPCLKNTCPLGTIECLDFDMTSVGKEIRSKFNLET